MRCFEPVYTVALRPLAVRVVVCTDCVFTPSVVRSVVHAHRVAWSSAWVALLLFAHCYSPCVGHWCTSFRCRRTAPILCRSICFSLVDVLIDLLDVVTLRRFQFQVQVLFFRFTSIHVLCRAF